MRDGNENMRTRVFDNIYSERTLTLGGEMYREACFRDENYIGEVIYVRRKRNVGSDYGWRPAKALRGKLVTKREAIKMLPQYEHEYGR